jgi:hypothetical protein
LYAEKNPRAGLVPNATCELEALSVIQTIVAVVPVIPVEVTPLIKGAVVPGGGVEGAAKVEKARLPDVASRPDELLDKAA